jgi:hypothetical protein
MVRVLAGPEIFVFSKTSTAALRPTQSLIQTLPRALSQRVKRLGRETAHSSPSSTEINNCWISTSTTSYAVMTRKQTALFHTVPPSLCGRALLS